MSSVLQDSLDIHISPRDWAKARGFDLIAEFNESLNNMVEYAAILGIDDWIYQIDMYHGLTLSFYIKYWQASRPQDYGLFKFTSFKGNDEWMEPLRNKMNKNGLSRLVKELQL